MTKPTQIVTVAKLVEVLTSVGYQGPGVVRIECTAPVAVNLPIAHKKALHVFVHETLASLNRLYTIVSPDAADAVLDLALSKIK